MKNMKIKKDKNEEMKVISHQSIIQNWEKEFEAILKQKKEKTMELFPVDKEWFENYKNKVLSNNISIDKKIENYYKFLPFDNSNILHDKNSINPISSFILLNKESMDSFSHYIIKKKQFDIKIIARFLNGKMVSKIGKQLYYFYFVDNKNDIKEGFLIFGNLDIQLIYSIIIDFQTSDVNLFLNNYFDSKPTFNEKFIIYHRNEFDLLIKNNNYNSLKKYNLKKITMPKNIKSISNEIYKSNKNIHHINPYNKSIKDINYNSNKSYKPNRTLYENDISKENDKYYELKSPNFYNFSKFRNIDFGKNKINSSIHSNIVDSIFQYYYSEEILKQFINNKGQYKIFQMINKNWLENFKDKIYYNQIKSILNGKESGQFQKIIQDFINNNNLNNIKIDNIPEIKKNYINGKAFYYYNDYQLISQSCFSQFCKSFGKDCQNNKKFDACNLDNQHVFIKYKKEFGEIITYNNQNIEHMYIIESENHLDDILKSLKNVCLEDGLKKYGINVNNFFGQQKTLKYNNSEKSEKIGIIIFLNNQNNNKNIISSDEEIIKNDENVFDNTQKRKESRNKNNINEINTPKIIRKRRVLHKSNIKNSLNGKEDKTFESFKTPIINHKTFSKFDNNNENNNIYFKKSSDHSNIDKNLNKTITNLKYLKKSNSNIFFEPNNNPKELNFSNSIHSKSPPSKNSKIRNNNQNISKFNSNQIKFSNNNYSFSKPINFKNKSKSEKIPNEEIYTSPSLKVKKTKEIIPSKKKKIYIRPPSFPKEINKSNKLNKKYDFNPKLKNNNNYLSPKVPKKRYEIKPPTQPPVDEESFHQNTPGLIGLQNIGATCYMNATLQCFSNTQRFREGILRLKKNNSQNKELSYSLKEVLVNLWKNDKIKYYAPYNFKNIISQMNPLFKGVQANDSKDLILFILETIHRELNQKKETIPDQGNVNNLDFNAVFEQFTKFYKANNKSIVSDEFYGYFVSIMKCGYCNKVTFNVQIMNILIFPLEKVRIFAKNQYNFVTLDDCFRNYEETELLAGSDQIYCNLCNMTTNAYNQNKLISTPKTIIINLNRGKGLQFKVGIKLEEYIDIKKYLLMSDKSPNYYELVGVISHFGESNMGGHFISYCKNSFDGKWYKFNDAMVNESSFQEASNVGLPYVLFYSYLEN